MYYSKQIIEKCIRKGTLKKGKHRRSPKSSGGMGRNRSFLSMDNLDIDEQNEDEDKSDKSSKSSLNSSDEDDSKNRRQKNAKQYDSDHDQ